MEGPTLLDPPLILLFTRPVVGEECGIEVVMLGVARTVLHAAWAKHLQLVQRTATAHGRRSLVLVVALTSVLLPGRQCCCMIVDAWLSVFLLEKKKCAVSG